MRKSLNNNEFLARKEYFSYSTFMINIPATIRKGIGELATVLNQFKSEAVQVKLLDRFLSGVTETATAVSTPLTSAAPKRRGRPPGSGAKKVLKDSAVVTVNVGKKRGRKRSKMGATGALHKLMASGFFKTRRSISDVTEACKNKLGMDIAVTNLSGPLMRFVSEKKLLRAKNKDDKFEYWAK
jgi:hypothetical protein